MSFFLLIYSHVILQDSIWSRCHPVKFYLCIFPCPIKSPWNHGTSLDGPLFSYMFIGEISEIPHNFHICPIFSHISPPYVRVNPPLPVGTTWSLMSCTGSSDVKVTAKLQEISDLAAVSMGSSWDFTKNSGFMLFKMSKIVLVWCLDIINIMFADLI